MSIQESQKSVTVSVQLVPGRDDDILKMRGLPGVNLSDVLRQGARLLIRREAGQQGFETEVLDGLDRIETLLARGGGLVSPPPDKPKFGNSILDSSP